MNISKDIWINILSYLKDDLKTLAIFTRTSKYYNILTNNNYLWKYFYMQSRNDIIDYKEIENWKQLYYEKVVKVIKTIRTKNNVFIVKLKNNKCYINGTKLLIYEPEEDTKSEDTKSEDTKSEDTKSKQDTKLLNIIDIYTSQYFSTISVISSDNKLYNAFIRHINEIVVKKIELPLEENDIIKKVIHTRAFLFIIIKNNNINKICVLENNIFKLIKSINFDIINIEYIGITKEDYLYLDLYEFLNINNFHKISYLDQTNFNKNSLNKQRSIEINNKEIWAKLNIIIN